MKTKYPYQRQMRSIDITEILNESDIPGLVQACDSILPVVDAAIAACHNISEMYAKDKGRRIRLEIKDWDSCLGGAGSRRAMEIKFVMEMAKLLEKTEDDFKRSC